MDQQKIGNYLRELRKQNNMTQEQLAEKFGTTSRSVSRWETGTNLPDLSVLVELASFYDVDLNDVINGGKNEHADDSGSSIEKVVEYADADKGKLKKQMVRNNVIAFVLITISMCLYLTGDVPYLTSEIRKVLLGFSLGLSLVVMLRNIFVFSGKSGCYRTGH